MKHRTSTQDSIEAAVFRKLVTHLQARTDVQNIELMNLAGFCRNCLSKWFVTACADAGVTVTYDDARELVYGMSYSEWKTKHQSEASSEQLEQYREQSSKH